MVGPGSVCQSNALLTLALPVCRQPSIGSRVNREVHARLCVQLRLVCSAGGRPAGAKVRRPVVWIAGLRETKILKPIDKVSLGETTSYRAVTTVNEMWPRK